MKTRFISLITAVVFMLSAFTGCGNDLEGVVGTWYNEDEDIYIVINDEETGSVIDYDQELEFTYTLEDTKFVMTAEDEDETLEGTLEDKELTIDGLDSKFEWIDESVDYPIEEEEEEEVEEDVDTDEDYYYSDESDESEDDEPMSFWYGDYESIDGESTISIEYSIIDYAVDYDFSIPTGYMSGTWQAADESALDVLYDSTLIITYEDDGTLYIEARNSDVEEAYTGYFYPVE